MLSYIDGFLAAAAGAYVCLLITALIPGPAQRRPGLLAPIIRVVRTAIRRPREPDSRRRPKEERFNERQRRHPARSDRFRPTIPVANSPSPIPTIRNTRFVSVAGGAYAILLTGEQTGGRYCLIDMFVPPGGGPPPHRHDFEEMFTILEGEIELTFREEAQLASAGSTVNIPANAPHAFKNKSDKPARLLCMCTPPGQEVFFLAVGARVDSRVAPAPPMGKEEQAEFMKKVLALAPKFRTELLVPRAAE